MNKKIVWIIGISISIVILGYALFAGIRLPEVDRPDNIVSTATSSTAENASEIALSDQVLTKELKTQIAGLEEGLPKELQVVYGKIDYKSTVCKNLKIVSARDPYLEKDLSGRPINSDGTFVAIVSNEAPQLIFAQDGQAVCLMSFSFPDSKNPVIIDSKSTALVATIGSAIDEESSLQKAEQLENFSAFYQALKNELKIKSLSEISPYLLDIKSDIGKAKAALDKEILKLINNKLQF